jgi:hypothetical protein
MGCQNSKMNDVEDSIHVILVKERKKRQGGAAAAAATSENGNAGDATATVTYKPRQEHPNLQPISASTKSTTNTPAAAGQVVTEPEDGKDDNLEGLLYHAAHHNDSIDPRDLNEYGGVSKEEDEQEEGQQ